MNKRGLALLILGVLGASRLMGPNGAANREKVRGTVERLGGRLERVLGRASGSRDTRFRGEFTEARGMGRERVADVESAIDELAGR